MNVRSRLLRRFPAGNAATIATLAAVLILNGCAMFSNNGPKVPTRPPPPSPPRSEMVLLNMSEASGWVAYDCDPEAGEETETYRIVVIRQASGEIIYDSQVPLTANLCTHGFEMAPTDPRLEQLARNVDRNIIAPLESHGNSEAHGNSTEKAAPGGREPQGGISVIDAESKDVEPSDTGSGPEPAAAGESASDTGADTMVPGKLEGVRIVSVEGKQVTLLQEEDDLLAPGRRYFLRYPPKVIALPGYEQDSLVSKGEVAGLIEVDDVDGTDATARLLSGEAPAEGYLEPTLEE